MNVLVIGYSSLARRRIIPALSSIAEIDKISIASRRDISADVLPFGKLGTVFHGYAEALNTCEPCLAYVSLPNSLHAEWVSKALHAGFHVIVDKPSVTDVSDAEAIIQLASRNNLCLAEANVWYYHPLVQSLSTLASSEKASPKTGITIFTSPRVHPPTVHYDKSLGGGVLFDRGSYAITCGRTFFGAAPDEIICRCFLVNNVDISCTIQMRYSNGSTLVSFLSLDAEYQNMFSIVGSGYRMEAQRIFTPPADYQGAIRAVRANVSQSITVPPADTFALFIRDVLNSIKNNSFKKFPEVLLDDARIMHRLITSAFGENHVN